ncbi:monoamine oxidase [Salinadaptatus halalkaliphilus]|uniref:Monoamine oxidase n=1 Tax=Salinadaptatus halalkaliphilus TaxID=2419781 RepID=A0A4S3TJ08_9EURY|nr:MaoC/PaaZ C-terminal domain-containing protein [Salinadaptatus halalkaliphilus]THE63961.1 monoamine oxidase [Salinadaptatus halalkaliphilus]
MSARGAKYFEDFEDGESITTASRTLTEADLVNFCSLTGDWNQLHSSEPFARDSHMDQRIFSGPQVFSYAIGLVGRTNIFEGTIKAILGFDDFTFHVPTHPGDTIHVVATVAETSESDTRFADDAGQVTVTYDVRNEDDDTIAVGDVRLLVFKRGETE